MFERRSAILAGLAALFSVSGLARAAVAEEPGFYDEVESEIAVDDSLPPSSARTNLLLVGGVATVGFYGVAYGTSYLWPSSPVAEDLRIPVIGPYSAVFNAGCGDHERGCGTFYTILRTTLATISAIGQTGGVLLLTEGVFMSTDAGSTGTPARGAGARVPAGGRVGSDGGVDAWYASPVVDDRNLGFVVGGAF